MRESDFEEYRKDIDKILDLLGTFASESSDNSTEAEIPKAFKSRFKEIFENISRLKRELLVVRKDLSEQKRLNSVRMHIWQIASDKSLKENDLIQELLNTVGPALNVSRANFSRLHPEEKVGITEVQWLKEGVHGEIAAKYPSWLVTQFIKKPYLIISNATIPQVARPVVTPFFKKFNVKSMLIVTYGDINDIKGLLTIDDCETERVWTENEINIFIEVSRIIKARADQIDVERELRSVNEYLENRVKEQTADLFKANKKLLLDIAELKVAEESIKENEQRLRAITETAHEAIISTDNKGRIIFWNSGAKRMFGYSMEEIVGKPVSVIIPPSYQGTIDHENLKASEIETSGRIIESCGYCKDRTELPIEISVSKWKSMGKDFLTAIIRNIKKRKEVEKQLAEENELLDVTLKSISDGVISTDSNGMILLINKSACKLTGYSEDDAVGKNLGSVLEIYDKNSHNKIENMVGRIFERGELAETEYVVVNNTDKSECNITCSGTVMRGNDNATIGAVLVLRNIMEKRKMEEELFKARKLESVGILAGGIAHDFNNIITGVVTNLFMIKMNLKTGSDSYNMLNEAEKACYRAIRLTKQLLTFSHGGEPIKENASIKELIEDSVGFCLSGSNVDCKLEIQDDLDTVEIDRGQIDQVLNNLIINADQAMPDGGTITIKAENITISDNISQCTEAHIPLRPGRYVKISVKDEGIGIPKKNIDKIFDPYFTTKEDGTGLGLTTVYSIIQKHDGFITVKSHPNKGCTFLFYIPSIKKEDNEEKKEEIVDTGETGGRILVMDDEEVLRVVIEKLLKNYGYSVTCVKNGFEAIEYYENAIKENLKFDAVIMDLTIPGSMGGKEAIKNLLKIDPEAKVIVASGYSNDPVMANYQDYGFSGVVEKPFNVDEYLRVIKEVMDK